jgi:beta-lactamase superfamily II metal-dependent hydrolase
MPSRLGIHVFGGKLGESIAVELPNGEWGMIDCYVSELSNWENAPINKFLFERGVKRLRFLCLTHPHLDHFRGMSNWADKTEEFWLYGGTSNMELFKKIFASLVTEKKLYPLYEKQITERIDELTKTIRIGRQSSACKKIFLTMPLLKIETEEGAPLEVTALGSTHEESLKYEDSLSKCFEGDGKSIFLATNLRQVNHNQISSGLVIRWGETCVILGGDMETASWKEVEQSSIDLNANLVKVSHHASETSYTDSLWSRLSPYKNAIGVFTCFGSQGLPKKSVLTHVLKNVSNLFTTSGSTCMRLLDDESVDDLSGIYDDIDIIALLGSDLDKVSLDDDRDSGRCSFYFTDRGVC